jgi:ABC-type Mn2+/Zn2+ transport system permease subunit
MMAPCWVLREQTACGFGLSVTALLVRRTVFCQVWCGHAALFVVGVGCVLFENCIVDASIFIFGVFLVFVVKLLRADGGCLGIRSR